MTLRRFALPLALAALLFAGNAGCADKPAETPSATLRSEFHSAFLTNLHHFLIDAARHPGRIDTVKWAAPLTPDETAAMHDAAAFYATTFGKRNPLLDVLASDGVHTCAEYAQKNGVYARAWPQYLPLLRNQWHDWLAGRGSLKAAVDAMLATQPAAETPAP